jgi:hypothetical protein
MGISEKEYKQIEEQVVLSSDIAETMKNVNEDDLIRWNCAGTCCGSCADRCFELKEETEKELKARGLLK